MRPNPGWTALVEYCHAYQTGSTGGMPEGFICFLFSGDSLSSLNLAEIGHSTLKRNRPLFLVDAAWEDVCSMIIEQEFTKCKHDINFCFY